MNGMLGSQSPTKNNPSATFYYELPLSPPLGVSTCFTLLLRVVDLSEREGEAEKAGKMISDNP